MTQRRLKILNNLLDQENYIFTWPDLVPMLNPAHGVREGAASVGEAHLESGKALEHAAHQHRHDSRGSGGRHTYTKKVI